MKTQNSNWRPELSADLPTVFYQPVRKSSCPVLSVDSMSNLHPKRPLLNPSPICPNQVPQFETYPTLCYDMQCQSSMHCMYTPSHIKSDQSLDNEFPKNDKTKDNNLRFEPPTLEELRIYAPNDLKNFLFEPEQNSSPRVRGKRTEMPNKYRSFKSFQSDLNLEQSRCLRDTLKYQDSGYCNSSHDASIPNMSRGVQSINDREPAAITCEQPAIARGRREEANCQLKEATFSPYQLSVRTELARKAWSNKRNSSTTLSWSPKLLLHLLLLLSSLITTSAMNIREFSSVVRRDVPKTPFEPFFTDDTSSSRNRRSSGSIQDILPPGAPGAPTGGNLGEFGTECQVNSCNEWLHMAHLNYNKIESCVIFHNDLKCLQKIENSCRYNMYYMGHKTWADNVFQQRNCSEVLKNYTDALPTIKPAPYRNRDNLCFIEDDTGVSTNSQPVFCSLFGDPHIVTYGGRKQTCTTLGAWPLVDNQFFTIQAVNVPIGDEASSQPTSQTAEKGRPANNQKSTESSYREGSEYSRSNSGAERDANTASETTVTSASAITRVLVVFRARLNCVEREMIYDTTDGSLPPSFNDGTFSVGPTDNLFVIQSSNGSVIELTANYIKTNIIIRRIGAYLSISVKSPVDVAKALPSYGHTNQDFHMELCSAGCPDVETLAEFPATPRPPRRGTNRVSYETARQRCNHLAGFFLDSCIFDVMTTGDWKTFVEIGQRSSEDESRLNIRSANNVAVEKLFPAPVVEKSSSSSSVNICSSTRLVWLIITTFLSHLIFHWKYSI